MELKGGVTLLAIGPPGTGKSWLLGTAVEVPGIERALLLAPKPREVNSYKYREHSNVIDTEVFRDHAWAPAADSFQSGAFTRLFQRVLSLYEDETYDAIIVDPFTDVTYLAAHELLESERAATPKELRDSIGFYGSLKYKLKDFTLSLTGLASPDLARPKHVFCAVHAQPTKEEDIKGKATAEAAGKNVEFMGEALPQIEGAYRREIAGEFDIVSFSSLTYENVRDGSRMRREARYSLQLNADPQRHAKIALIPRMEQQTVGNSLPEVFEVIRNA